MLDHIALTAEFDTRDTERALEGSGISVPPLETYAEKLWDYWERNLDPDLFKDRSFEGAVNGKVVMITGASSGIGRAAAIKIAAAGGIPILVARGEEKLNEVKDEIESRGGTAHVYTADLSDMDSLDDLVDRVLADHARIDILVNNAGRSIRRSIALSYDRFHDFERTMQLNYFGAIKLIIGLLPHMREQQVGPHRQRLLDRRADQPAAVLRLRRLEGGAGRVHPLRRLGGHRRQRPLHHDPHAAGAHADDRADQDVRLVPDDHADEAADMVCEAIRAKPKQINTRLGTFGEVAYTLAPKAVDQILHMAYKVFPTRRRPRARRTRTRRRRSSRSRWPT